MRKLFSTVVAAILLVDVLLPCGARATETENNTLRIMPAAGKPALDGSLAGWDLTGGIFACSDVENARNEFALWFHGMYDADNLYLLARFADTTPLDNPGVTSGDMGFLGDCLQVRLITAPNTPNERVSHLTAWRGRDGKDLVDVSYGKGFNEGKIPDAKTKGASQAFRINDDKKGYAQVVALPWKLLTKDGAALKPGDNLTLTLEPNFTIGGANRLTIKDIFKPGIVPDRAFTFSNSQNWGVGTLESTGPIEPSPVRLSDGRKFPVHMEGGQPAPNWNGLVQSRELAGFKPLEIKMPEDGYASVIIKDASGKVVRQLLATEFLTKGSHQVKWDGLTTANWRTPGEPVAPGEYTWSGIYHTGLGLRLKGWAANSGQTPWDFPARKGNWGGDHGIPVSVATHGERVYLGWDGAEAGKSLLACDLQGMVQWNNSHGAASRIAIDGDAAYVLSGMNPGRRVNLYRVNVKDGAYMPWNGSDSTDLSIPSADDLDARAGQLFLAYAGANQIQLRDSQTGKEIKTIAVPSPKAICVSDDKTLLAVSGGNSIVSVDIASGQVKPLIADVPNAVAVATDKAGQIYVGVGEPDNQVKVFSASGQSVGEIGRKGGRQLLGAWQSDGMRFISDISIATDGKLWVAEADRTPKRVSSWDPASGKLVKEFFGPTGYGAMGGAICPTDPSVMVGQGCEWKLDAKTGQAACVAVITRAGMESTRFGMVDNRVYLATSAAGLFNIAPIHIYERLGDGKYADRTVLYYADADGKEMAPTGQGETRAAKTGLWVDANGDQQRQPDEVTLVNGVVRVCGWYMNITPEMAMYAGNRQYKIAGLSPCGAPKYDLTRPTKMPAAGLGSADGRLVLKVGDYGIDNGWFTCYDIASGKELWQYPDNFIGVHGSHRAPPAEAGLIRGSYGATGTVKLPAPVGNVWVIGTNVGEWHMLTEGGYYLGHLFQGNPLKVQFPEPAVPEAVADNVPSGGGSEDFGGSATLTTAGALRFQVGKTAFWNVEVTGLETVKAIPGSAITFAAEDVKLAQGMREQLLKPKTVEQKLAIKHATVNFTGDLGADFTGAQIVQFKKQDDAAVRAAAAWDDKTLYLAWEVKDATPWINGSTDPFMMYLSGDTVDFQVASDPKAEAKRSEAAMGDLRLSIGDLKGKPTAVVYRKVATEKHPHVFSSGVIKEYTMDSVTVLRSARIQVTKRDKGYTVEAAIPLTDIGLQAKAGLTLKGDFGATHGGPDGQRTRLRTYWSNQSAGIVDDAVFELQMQPAMWGQVNLE